MISQLKKCCLLLLLSLWCSQGLAQEVISSFSEDNISVLNDELRSLDRKIRNKTFTTNLESQYTPTDDNVLVGNGSIWERKSINDCDSATAILRYDQTTNAFSCGALPSDVGSWEYVTGGAISGTSFQPTFTVAANYIYKMYLYFTVTNKSTYYEQLEINQVYGKFSVDLVSQVGTTALSGFGDTDYLTPYMPDGSTNRIEINFAYGNNNTSIDGNGNVGKYEPYSYIFTGNYNSQVSNPTFAFQFASTIAGRYFVYRSKQ